MIEEVDVFELNGNQQSALIRKATKEIINELCKKQSALLKIIDKAVESSFEYREVMLSYEEFDKFILRLELTQKRKSGITTKYTTSIIIPPEIALYALTV